MIIEAAVLKMHISCQLQIQISLVIDSVVPGGPAHKIMTHQNPKRVCNSWEFRGRGFTFFS